MRIAVDVDGVLADTIAVWIKVFNGRYSASISPSQVDRWNFYEKIGISKSEFYEIFSEAWSRWHEIHETEEGLSKKVALYKNVGSVDIVTGRSADTLPYVRSWLESKNIKYDKLVGLAPSSSKAKLRYDLYVDDAPKVAADVAKRRHHILLYDQPWNREVEENEYIARIKNLSEGYGKALALKKKIESAPLTSFG